MECWKCGAPLLLSSSGKVAPKAICDICFAYLHCCKNCKNYQVGLPNNCKIPGTEYIADREANNYCDEFVLLAQFLGQAQSKKNSDEKKRFDDLFNE